MKTQCTLAAMHREIKLKLTWNTPQREGEGCWLAFLIQKMQCRLLGKKRYQLTYPVVDPARYNTDLLGKMCPG